MPATLRSPASRSNRDAQANVQEVVEPVDVDDVISENGDVRIRRFMASNGKRTIPTNLDQKEKNMPRLQPVKKENADSATAELLGSIEKKMGKAPNIIATMANSPAVAKAYLGFSQPLSSGRLPARLREQIALVVGEANNCGYCVAAHTALGKAAGLTEAETCDARCATAKNEKERAALQFAHQVVSERGWVSDEDVQRVRQAGYNDGEIGEIVANVALNIFTNYFNHVAKMEVDFPAAPELATA